MGQIKIHVEEDSGIIITDILISADTLKDPGMSYQLLYLPLIEALEAHENRFKPLEKQNEPFRS